MAELPAELANVVMPPDKGDRWSKMFCPLCGHKRKSAGVNYALSWFHCWACGVDFCWRDDRPPPDWSVIDRFRPVIGRIAGWANVKFPWSIDRETAIAVCEWRVLVYAAIMPLSHVEFGPGDWGKLEAWERESATDDALARKVGQALKRDMTCYFRRVLVRRGAERDIAREPSKLEQPGDSIPWMNSPFLAMRFRDHMPIDEIAEATDLSSATVKRRIRAELDALR